MHTAFQLQTTMFSTEIDDEEVPAGSALGWLTTDRLGVVVDRPLGALGASLLIQLAITSYFDARPTRRTHPHYADVYLFHVGGRWGEFSTFDFWPERRQVFLPADPVRVLQAINDRGITVLAVPDVAPAVPFHRYKEVEAAQDRIRLCLAFDPEGEARESDMTIRTDNRDALDNLRLSVSPEDLLAMTQGPITATDPAEMEDERIWRAYVQAHVGDASADALAAARPRVEQALATGRLIERYRRIEVGEAVGMLGPFHAISPLLAT